MAPLTGTARAPRDPSARRGRRRGATTAAASALVVALGLLLAACSGSGDDEAPTSGSTGGTSGSSSAGQDGGSATADGSDATDGTGQGTTQDQKLAESETNAKVPERSPAPTTLPGLDGVQVSDAVTLTGALPTTASARGTLVAGFPELVLPSGTALEVVSSSVSAEGARLQIGLEAGTAVAQDDVRAAFTATLEALGFRSEESPALPGNRATAYVHGDEGLVLTTHERTGGGTELSVAGTLETAP
ncbi:hypothetical protein [Cellulomonas soli]|uniref:Uncharacterized protein n=1 Tax=Cellulomonas soli TaxID=931535 RepID=A0A512PG03_9CELL|nr:hypothetical protein [Cellulomonas soli]NYI59718.1 hypothetical protein [Cellulomonas soli]GEP70139.1 hypothetical protein CSO01_28540 [Cellulomonas soli]